MPAVPVTILAVAMPAVPATILAVAMPAVPATILAVAMLAVPVMIPEQISMGKFHNVNAALEIARSARSILGGAGITSEYSIFRHMSNLETVLTYEGTHEIHMLVLGQALTGIAAFR